MLASAIASILIATPRPPPGPGCAGRNIPIANQSSPTGKGDCPGNQVIHNASCGGPNGVQWELKPTFHVGSKCHGENDPNGPFYDAKHGVYHLFFQDHIPMQVGGHLATTDFIHWKRLPIAIWPDQWYDKDAIWTFSATIVPGVGPRIVYPGIAGPNASLGDCSKKPPPPHHRQQDSAFVPTGAGCFTHALARPSNRSDPWLRNWSKPPSVNPIVTDHINSKGRDPTTAWRIASGGGTEWRYTDAHQDVYSTHDWKHFTHVGVMNWSYTGDCPDFYPLPRACDGCIDSSAAPPTVATATAGAARGSTQPTHVAASIHYTLGTYEEGAANTSGTWTPLTPLPVGPLDGSAPKYYYAAKSFADTAAAAPRGSRAGLATRSNAETTRRIVWGWIRIGGAALEIDDARGVLYPGFHPGGCDTTGLVQTNVNSLPREVTYDAALGILLFFPLVELTQLRGDVLGSIATPTRIRTGQQVPIGSGSGSSGSGDGWLHSELRVAFALPLAAGTRVGIEMRGGTRADGTRFSVEIFAEYVDAAAG